MKKKLFSLMVIVLVLFGFVACDDSTPTPVKPTEADIKLLMKFSQTMTVLMNEGITQGLLDIKGDTISLKEGSTFELKGVATITKLSLTGETQGSAEFIVDGKKHTISMKGTEYKLDGKLLDITGIMDK